MFTVGYERFNLKFRNLYQLEVQKLIDVRENPQSKRQEYRKLNLSIVLPKKFGIEYIHIQELGNPEPVRERYKKTGNVSEMMAHYYDWLLLREEYLKRYFEQITEDSALMCYEHDILICHRLALSVRLKELGYVESIEDLSTGLSNDELVRMFRNLTEIELIRVVHGTKEVRKPTKLCVAIVGSREFTNYEFMKEKANEIMGNQEVCIVSGGARGADELARRYAVDKKFDMIEILADWGKHGKTAGMLRNSEIVNLADVLIAFPTETSRGTWDAVRKAEKKGIEVHVFES